MSKLFVLALGVIILTVEARASVARPTILHFWATWCPFCIGEMTELDTYVAKKPDRTIVVVSKETTDTQIQFYRSKNLKSVQGLLSVSDVDGKLHKEHKITGLPTTVFLDETGKETRRTVGPVKWADEPDGLIPFLVP